MVTNDPIREYADLILSVHEYSRTHREHPPALCYKLDVIVNELDARFGKDAWLAEAGRALGAAVAALV